MNQYKQGIWRYPTWEEIDTDYWHLRKINEIKILGEVYRFDSGIIKWHCKTSDWRDTSAKTIEQAMAECESSYWKNEWEILRKIVNDQERLSDSN